jgi:hypothetical protein
MQIEIYSQASAERLMQQAWPFSRLVDSMNRPVLGRSDVAFLAKQNDFTFSD